MARIIEHIQIASPVDRVAAFFVPQRMVYWYGAEMQAEFEMQEGAADFATGQKVRITGRVAGREIKLTAVVTRYVPLQTLEWRFRDEYDIRGTQRWDLEPVRVTRLRAGDAPHHGAMLYATRVVMLDDYTMPGRFGKWWDRLVMKRAVRKRNREWLETLRRVCERS